MDSTSDEFFRRREINMGWIAATALSAVMLLGLSVWFWQSAIVRFAALLFAGCAVILLYLFWSFEVVVTGDSVDLRFGPGLVGDTIAVEDIESCETTDHANMWLGGQGCHPGNRRLGWAKGPAVAILRRDGCSTYVYCALPSAFREAVQKAMATARHPRS